MPLYYKTGAVINVKSQEITRQITKIHLTQHVIACQNYRIVVQLTDFLKITSGYHEVARVLNKHKRVPYLTH